MEAERLAGDRESLERRVGGLDHTHPLVAMLESLSIEFFAELVASTHKHCCTECGSIWEHSDAVKIAAPQVRRAAHTCPACKTPHQSERYHGGSAAEYRDHHLGKQADETGT